MIGGSEGSRGAKKRRVDFFGRENCGRKKEENVFAEEKRAGKEKQVVDFLGGRKTCQTRVEFDCEFFWIRRICRGPGVSNAPNETHD